MTAAVSIFVVACVVLVAGLGLGAGLDAIAVILLALIVAVGGLAIAVSRRSAAGRAHPATCPECGGLNSPNAPYCKHCGRPLVS